MALSSSVAPTSVYSVSPEVTGTPDLLANTSMSHFTFLLCRCSTEALFSLINVLTKVQDFLLFVARNRHEHMKKLITNA